MLIFGTGYFFDDACVELCRLWARLLRHLNPDERVILIDSHSPFNPEEFLDRKHKIDIWRWPDNIGHMKRGGRDGPGRSLCKGLQMALDEGHDYAVHYECDVLFARPFKPLIDKMRTNGAKVVALPLIQYHFVGFEVSFWEMDWVRKTKFIERYDWPNAPRW